MSMVKKYRPLFILRSLAWIIVLLHLAFAGIVLHFSSGLFLRQPFWIIPFSSYVTFIFHTLICSLRTRLELSDGGILYDCGDYIISTSWNNVERIGKVPNGRIVVDGLILKNPSAIKRNFLAKIFTSRFMGHEVDYSRSIPLQGEWSWNWRKSKLADDLQHYLPHLF